MHCITLYCRLYHVIKILDIKIPQEAAMLDQLEKEKQEAEEEKRRQKALLEEQEEIAKEILKRDMENLEKEDTTEKGNRNEQISQGISEAANNENTEEVSGSVATKDEEIPGDIGAKESVDEEGVEQTEDS